MMKGDHGPTNLLHVYMYSIFVQLWIGLCTYRGSLYLDDDNQRRAKLFPRFHGLLQSPPTQGPSGTALVYAPGIQ